MHVRTWCMIVRVSFLLDSIEANVETAAIKVEHGNKELASAARHKVDAWHATHTLTHASHAYTFTVHCTEHCCIDPLYTRISGIFRSRKIFQ